MNLELAWMGASVFNGPKCKTDEAMVSAISVGEGVGEGVGAGAGAGAILDKLTNYNIFEVGVNVKLIEPRLSAAVVGTKRKRI